MPKRKLNNLTRLEAENKNKQRQSARLQKASNGENYSKLKEKEKDYADFANALTHYKHAALAESLFITLKDEISIIDEKYNLIDIIINSTNSYETKREWINKVILKCNSKVSPNALLYCATGCNPKILQLLLSLGADPNGATNYPEAANPICSESFTVITETVYCCHKYKENLYWLIVYGGDVCINHRCNSENYFCYALNANKNIREWLKNQPPRSVPAREMVKNYEDAVRDMRNEVIEYIKQPLIPDLYEIVFNYLAWPKIVNL